MKHHRAAIPRSTSVSTWAWLGIIAVYFSLNCLGHLEFSIWLVKGRTFTWEGQAYVFAFSYAVPWLATAAFTLLVFHVWRGARQAEKPLPVIAYWLVWAIAIWLVDRYLTYSSNEYAHLPQYGILAWLLARAFDPHRTRWPLALILLGTTALGALDELAQYLWITRSYSHYLDFNDVLVNMLGAAAGVMLYYDFSPSPSKRPLRRDAACVLAVAALLLALGTALQAANWLGVSPPTGAGNPPLRLDQRPMLWLQTVPGYYGSWQPGRRHARHWVLGPRHGLGLTLLAGLVWLPFGGGRGHAGAGKTRAGKTGTFTPAG